MLFTIVSGLSGAGKSSALKILEDIGFFCSDNIPPTMIPEFAQICLNNTTKIDKVAVAVDMRMGTMFDSVYDAMDKLKQMNIEFTILFLDADDEALVKRFKFTRRRHPVSGSGKIVEGIHVERENLQRIKDMANHVIDTSSYTSRELEKALYRMYATDATNRFCISVISFGFKRGIPIDADMVFDMRFLPNPYYNEELKYYCGLDKNVYEYVLGSNEAHFFLDIVEKLVCELLPQFSRQRKKQLVIAIGCTGGMHRSVAIAQELFNRIQKIGCYSTIEHRDLKLEQEHLKGE